MLKRSRWYDGQCMACGSTMLRKGDNGECVGCACCCAGITDLSGNEHTHLTGIEIAQILGYEKGMVNHILARINTPWCSSSTKVTYEDVKHLLQEWL